MIMKAALKNMLLAGVALAVSVSGVQASSRSNNQPDDLEHKVRHELVMLPYFTIFDNLAYKVEGTRVTLYGQVTQPVLKSDAQNVVKHIPGVETVDNQIEVLPLSPFDDQIRRAEARAIYGYGPLQRYAMGTQPPIRIIVRNGNVTLEGVVANAMDRNLVNVRANGVAGVFSVKNDLQLDARH